MAEEECKQRSTAKDALDPCLWDAGLAAVQHSQDLKVQLRKDFNKTSNKENMLSRSVRYNDLLRLPWEREQREASQKEHGLPMQVRSVSR